MSTQRGLSHSGRIPLTPLHTVAIRSVDREIGSYVPALSRIGSWPITDRQGSPHYTQFFALKQARSQSQPSLLTPLHTVPPHQADQPPQIALDRTPLHTVLLGCGDSFLSQAPRITPERT